MKTVLKNISKEEFKRRIFQKNSSLLSENPSAFSYPK
jgi:hypothetical protein